MRSYRYPSEYPILVITLVLVLTVIAVTATATVCGSVVFLVLILYLGYLSSRAHHQKLMRTARPVTALGEPELAALVNACQERLQPGPIEVYVAPSPQLNAYTFGLETPKVVVLYSALFQVMDADELKFIIGHELGHVALGHTWLNSLVGGLAGIPANSAASVLLGLAFLWWNRACEYSADRAGLLACQDPDKAVSALIKLVAGPAGSTQAGLQQAYRRVDAEDDTWLGSFNEALGSHPMLIRRINEIRRFAAH